jgi:hypothetical protein
VQRMEVAAGEQANFPIYLAMETDFRSLIA